MLLRHPGTTRCRAGGLPCRFLNGKCQRKDPGDRSDQWWLAVSNGVVESVDAGVVLLCLSTGVRSDRGDVSSDIVAAVP